MPIKWGAVALLGAGLPLFSPLGRAQTSNLAETISVTPPVHGFEQNVGQFPPEVRFGLASRILYRDRVKLTSDVWLHFSNANPLATLSGLDPLPATVNLYQGIDPKGRFENVPHFTAVRYGDIYPGIEIDFLMYERTGPTTQPGIRITVAPGADPALIRLSLATVTPLEWSLSPDSIRISLPRNSYFSIERLTAYQNKASGRVGVPVAFARLDSHSFQPVPGLYDRAAPLVFEFGTPVSASPYVWQAAIAPDNSVILGGTESRGSGSPSSSGFLSGNRKDGTGVFLSFFSDVGPAWLAAGAEVGITVIGGAGSGASPIVDDAPRPVSAGQNSWIGRFDFNGRLMSSTFTDGAVTAAALDSTGSVCFSSVYGNVTKWTPGQPSFAFTFHIPYVVDLATSAAGDVVFLVRGVEGLPVTAKAVVSRYEGWWTHYAGALDGRTGRLRMGTYVRVASPSPQSYYAYMKLAVAPGGELVIASSLSYNGTAHTLTILSADGSRILASESIPFYPAMAFDKAGNVLLAGMVQNPNLPASPDALLRAPCVSPNQPYRFQYFELRTIAGKLLHATYHPAGASATGIHGFEDLGRPFLLLYNSSAYNTPVVVRIHAARPATPQISCLVNPASRQSLNYLAPGDLAVISGALLGPRDTVQAAMTSEGKLPLELAGIQVLLGARPMPLVSVQHGSIIFHVPPETSQGGSVPLEVRSGGTFLAGRNVNVLSGQGQFVVFTTDGSGFGQAAAVNQDGSLNSEMAASEDSVVAIFGVGPTPTRVRLSYSETAIEYAGPAPGLIPGVKQVNLRILKSPYSWAKGDSLEQLVIEPAAAGAPRVYLRCVRRGS